MGFCKIVYEEYKFIPFAFSEAEKADKDSSSGSSIDKTNIESINKDAERLKSLNTSKNDDRDDFHEDVDDLSKYTHIEDGVKVLKDTTSINRKAIFHDLDRLKHWRESMDQDNANKTDSKVNEDNQTADTTNLEPIMEKNIDLILNQLPDVHISGDDKGSTDSRASEKLNQIEAKIKRRYTLDDS